MAIKSSKKNGKQLNNASRIEPTKALSNCAAGVHYTSATLYVRKSG